MPTVEVAHMLKDANALRKSSTRAAAVAAAAAISLSSKPVNAKKETPKKTVPAKKSKPASKLSVVEKGKHAASPKTQKKEEVGEKMEPAAEHSADADEEYVC